jgi:hypothetical protein
MDPSPILALSAVLALVPACPGRQEATSPTPDAPASVATVVVAREEPSSQPAATQAPEATPPAGASTPRERSDLIAGHLDALHKAGDANDCKTAQERIRASLAADRRFSDQDLERERDSREYRGKGSMPSPSPGTACAIFGIVGALEGAINDRRQGKGLAPKSWP